MTKWARGQRVASEGWDEAEDGDPVEAHASGAIAGWAATLGALVEASIGQAKKASSGIGLGLKGRIIGLRAVPR
jgi:hypothetical protein